MKMMQNQDYEEGQEGLKFLASHCQRTDTASSKRC